MAEKIGEATAVIRGKVVKFSAKRLKDGTVAFYRDGKRAWNAYQRRLARGILEGRSTAEATGRKPSSYKKWKSKFYTRPAINKELARYGKDDQPRYGTTDTGEVPWAEPPENAEGAFERRRYYAQVSIQVKSAIEAGSDIAHDEGAACTPATLALLQNRGGDLVGLTRAEFRKGLEGYIHDALRRAGLRLCTGDLNKDLISVWRHSRR